MVRGRTGKSYGSLPKGGRVVVVVVVLGHIRIASRLLGFFFRCGPLSFAVVWFDDHVIVVGLLSGWGSRPFILFFDFSLWLGL